MTGRHKEAKKFSITYTDTAQNETLDLPRLSDIFRRADKTVFEWPSLAAVFNKKAKMLMRSLALHELGGKADGELKSVVRQIVFLARDHDIGRVILPVSEHTVAGQHLRNNILHGENLAKFYNITIDFQNEPYQSSSEIEALGAPREGPCNGVFDCKLF